METKKQPQSQLERNKEIIKNIKLAYKNAETSIPEEIKESGKKRDEWNRGKKL